MLGYGYGLFDFNQGAMRCTGAADDKPAKVNGFAVF